MRRPLVAQVVGLVYFTSGRHFDEDVIDAWQIALDDVPDGADVLTVVRRLTREQDFVAAKHVWEAVRGERERAALRNQYRPPSGPVAGELEESRPKEEWDPDGSPPPETPGEWMAHIRARLRAAKGPLARNLRRSPIGGTPPGDQTHFESQPEAEAEADRP